MTSRRSDATHIDVSFLREIVDLLEDKRQVVIYGPPGTGKTWVALHLAEAISTGDPSRTDLVQFHPAMSYEDFIEGLRPEVTAADQVIYRPHDGQLMRIVERAEDDPGHTYVMIIDEINRANLPKVIGELLFLLEYRDRSVRRLYRPDESFRLPENLWFIGTMNTADRSIALIDAAMRRRFHFVPFFPHLPPIDDVLRRWLEANDEPPNLASFLAAVNAELLGDVGEHLLVGPSHFMKKHLDSDELRRIWTYNVFPLIEEMFWGQTARVDHWRWDAVRTRFAAQLGVAPSIDDASGDGVGETEDDAGAVSAASAFDE
jgi:5-methylcytosine-specific restriction protein B